MTLPRVNIFHNLRLELKLLLLFILVSGIPLILINLLWFNSSRNQILKATSDNLVTTTIDEAHEVDNYFSVKEVGLIIHSQTQPILGSDIPNATKELQSFILQDADITEISLLNKGGKEIIRLNRDRVFPDNELSDQSSSAGFKIPTFAGGEKYISQIYFTGNGEPGIYISVPIVQPNTPQDIQQLSTSSIGRSRKVGEILGVLKVNYSLTDLWKQLDSTKIGKSGYVFLVDDKGNTLAHPLDNYQRNQTNFKGDAEVEKFLLSLESPADEPVVARQTKNELGIPSLTANSKVKATSWGVISEIPLSDTFSDTNEVAIFAVVLLLVFINAVILFSLWVAGKIVEPIKLLQRGASLIGRGQLNERLNIKTGDEIETLANGFNSMAENLSRSIYQISAERNKVEVIISGISDAIIAVDLNRNIATFNKAAENLTGYTFQQAIGRPIQQVVKLSEKDEEISPEVYCPIKADNFEGIVFSKKDLTLKGSNDKISSVNIIIGKIKEGPRVNLGVIITLHDTSSEKQFEEMKLDFVSMAAHELRTPLTSLKGYLYILVRDYKKTFDEKENTILMRVSIATQRLVGLVENLLNVTRIERGALTVHLETTDWVDNVKQVVSELIDQAKDKKIELVFDEPKNTLPPVAVDKFRIAEVLTNLLSNAISYTQLGGNIRIWIDQTPNEIITHVKDSGEGIPAAALPHLFTKFFRVSGKLEQGSKGTGLGLYIAKSIINMHNGRIWAESEGVGKGSTFSFTLPLNHQNTDGKS